MICTVLLGCEKENSTVGTPAVVDASAKNESAYFNPAQPLIIHNPVQDKNFYFLSILQQNQNLLVELKKDTELKNIHTNLIQRLNKVTADPASNVSEMVGAAHFTVEEQQDIIAAFDRLVGSNLLSATLIQELKASGCYLRFEDFNDAVFIRSVWKNVSTGLEHILSVYGEGASPRDPDSDSVSYAMNDPFYVNQVRQAIITITESDNTLFFAPALQLCLQLLEINNRDEAGRFEPLSQEENATALSKLSNINWEDYSHSLILVLGDSPNSPGDAINLSESAKKRLITAADRYHTGVAPLLLISGANVYPFQTSYHEAIEMKKYLLENFNIPEEAVLVDPHARHTTTNFRNTSRQIYRYGLPKNKACLAVATASHMDYIMSPSFQSRCMKDLGYFPLLNPKRLNPTDIEFYPVIYALHIDPSDPLDP